METSSFLGATQPVFYIFTCLGMGWIAFMTGRALAGTWRPAWQILPYGILLGLANRFFVYALFGGPLLSFSGWVVSTVYLIVIGLLSYKEKQAYKMVAQYPWLYVRKGPLGWQERKHTSAET